MTISTIESTNKKAPFTFKAVLMALASTLCLVYGNAFATEPVNYWPPSQETFTENSMAINHIGSAMRYHGKKPVYIASLYSEDEFPNTAVLYTNDGAKELQLIVMDESMSHRRFKRILKNDLIVTLNDEEYTKLQPKINELLSSIKSNFRVGSLVTIAYDSLRDATIVRVDTERKATIDGKELFNATLKAMVGKRPPSREFKDALLGHKAPIIDLSIEQELLLTQYIDNRFNNSTLKRSNEQEFMVSSDIRSEY